MEQEKITKIIFFSGYNYHLRFFNIIRKIEDLKKNADRLQNIVNNSFEPPKFKGGIIVKNGKKFEVKKLKINMTGGTSRDFSHKKEVSSIPYTEECEYYLMVEILSETTQYCADLGSIIIGLRDFNTSKATFSQIADAKIKEWYKDLKHPTIYEFIEIFDLLPLNQLPLEERFVITLNYEKILWNLNKIGRFYWYNYDYIYTPFRHGMKGSFFKDSENRIFCRTLTKDKKWNLYYLSEERIKECKEIAEYIFSIFHNDLKPILFSKVLSPSQEKIRLKVPEAPKYPIRPFDSDYMVDRFTSLKNVKIYQFSTNDVASIHEFAMSHKQNFSFKYKKMKSGTSSFVLDGTEHFLDELFSHSKRLKIDECLIISNCPLAFFIELTYITIINNRIYDFVMSQIKESIYHYLAIEKNINYVLEDPAKVSHRTDQFREITNEIMKDFILLVGLYMNKDHYIKFQFSDEEIDFLVYVHQKNIIRLFNTKNYMKRLYPDIILQIILKLLILNYFRSNQVEVYSKELKMKKIDDFFNKSGTMILKSVEKELDLELLLDFMNYLFNTINNLET